MKKVYTGYYAIMNNYDHGGDCLDKYDINVIAETEEEARLKVLNVHPNAREIYLYEDKEWIL